MVLFFNQLLNGIGSGAIYASLALGLVLIYRTTGLLNFAQGEIALFSTYVTWWLADKGLPIGLAVGISVLLAFAGGALLQLLVMRRFAESSALVVVIVTIGLFLLFNSVAQWMFGSDAKKVPSLFPTYSTGREAGNQLALDIGGVKFTSGTVGLVIILAAECAALFLLLNHTKVGLALRSVASNAESARLVGISTGTMLMLGWAIAGVLGSLAGVGAVANLNNQLDPTIMQRLLVYAFAAAAIGGFDSVVGAIVGGLIVGVAGSMTIEYIDKLQKIDLVVPFALILIVFLVRPSGLFGRRVVERV